MAMYGISTRLRQAAFISQILHESACFLYVKEIASGEAYEGRKDLGNTIAGDGRRFKGRGLIQITGRTNYQAISKAFNIDFVNKPELLQTNDNAVRSACWWWQQHGLNEQADKGNIKPITKIINGGYNGLKERLGYYNKALEVITE